MRFTLAIVLSLMVGSANSATYVIDGGSWTSVQRWSDNWLGYANYGVYDADQAAPPALLFGNAGIINWIPGDPGLQTGRYSGTIITDAPRGQQGNVIGGTLTVTGKIGEEIQLPSVGHSWRYHEYDGLVIDFATGTATAAAANCYETIVAAVGCDAVIPGMLDQWTPVAGMEGVAGAAHMAATFDPFFNPEHWVTGGQLSIFHENYAALGTMSSDTLNILDLSVVPVPAAAWLFGSAVGLLGWMRREQIA